MESSEDCCRQVTVLFSDVPFERNRLSATVPITDSFISILQRFFVEGAEDAFGEFVEDGSGCGISDFIVDAAGGPAFPGDGPGAVGDVADFAESRQFYADGFFVSFVVRFLDQADFHVLFKEFVPIIMISADNRKIDWFHDVSPDCLRGLSPLRFGWLFPELFFQHFREPFQSRDGFFYGSLRFPNVLPGLVFVSSSVSSSYSTLYFENQTTAAVELFVVR